MQRLSTQNYEGRHRSTDTSSSRTGNTLLWQGCDIGQGNITAWLSEARSRAPKLLKKLAQVLSTLVGSALYRSSSSSKYVLDVPSRKLHVSADKCSMFIDTTIHNSTTVLFGISI